MHAAWKPEEMAEGLGHGVQASGFPGRAVESVEFPMVRT